MRYLIRVIDNGYVIQTSDTLKEAIVIIQNLIQECREWGYYDTDTYRKDLYEIYDTEMNSTYDIYKAKEIVEYIKLFN